MILRFFWLVYDRGGPDDLAAAAEAVQQLHDPNWAAKLSRFLPSAGDVESPADGEAGNQDDEGGGPDDTTPMAA